MNDKAQTYTQCIKDVELQIEEHDADTYLELEGSLEVQTEELNRFLDELGDLIRRFQI